MEIVHKFKCKLLFVVWLKYRHLYWRIVSWESRTLDNLLPAFEKINSYLWFTIVNVVSRKVSLDRLISTRKTSCINFGNAGSWMLHCHFIICIRNGIRISVIFKFVFSHVIRKFANTWKLWGHWKLFSPFTGDCNFSDIEVLKISIQISTRRCHLNTPYTVVNCHSLFQG